MLVIQNNQDFGPVVNFRSSFEKAWSNMLNYIKNRREELKT